MTTEGPTYPIPDVVTPVGTVCYQLEIPNDPQHIQTVFGALASLASWFSWARDNAHNGKTLAALYSQMLNTFQECFAMDVRQNILNPCILEKETSPGVWVPFADLTLCPPLLQIGGSGILWKNPSGQWVPLPTQSTGDPRFDTPFPPPWPSGTVPPGQDGRCLSGANNLSAFKQVVTGICNDLNAGSIGLGVAGGIAGVTSLFMPVDVIAAFILTMAGLAVSLGAFAFCGLFDDPAFHKYQCILNCHAEADGSYTQADWNDIKTDVTAQFGDGQQVIILAWLDIIGSSGLTRLGKGEGITSADCSDCGCEWCVVFDFTSDAFTTFWSISSDSTNFTPPNEGVYASGYEASLCVGVTFVGAYRLIEIALHQTFHMTKIEVMNTYASGTFWSGAAPDTRAQIVTNNGTAYHVPISGTVPADILVPSAQDVTTLSVRLVTGNLDTPTDPGGSALITSIKIHGTGPNPFTGIPAC